MKKIIIILSLFVNGSLLAQGQMYISDNALAYKNEIFRGSKEQIVQIEISSKSPLPVQPTNPRIAVLALMNKGQRIGTGVFVRESQGQWLQIVQLTSISDISVELMKSSQSEMIGIKPVNCQNCQNFQYGYQKTIAPNGGIVWKEIYF